MSNILSTLLIFIFITSCSFNKSSKFWSTEKIIKDKQENVTKIFEKKETLNLEFNPNLKIKIYSKAVNKSSLKNLDNNSGKINYNGKLKSISKYKFSKIKNFYQYEPEIIFNKNNVIFFDNNGSVLNFDNKSNLKWKKNYYSKSERKTNPILFFAIKDNFLIVADNKSKLYALDVNTGKLLWEKKNSAPFNSQIKIYQDKFFITDFENILRSYLLKDGSEIWNFKTQNTLIRSQKKLSMVIVDEKVYFNNSLGDISSVDINTGELIWQTPTQNNLAGEVAFLLKTSDIIADGKMLYFSNNNDEFFSLDINTGFVNWKQKINSDLRPTIINDYIFTISMEGYLIIIEKKSGNIIRINDIFNTFKIKKRLKIKPTGFIIGNKNIYLSTNNGRLLEIDIITGKTKSILKIANKKISRPSILNQNLYIATDNSIIKLN